MTVSHPNLQKNTLAFAHAFLGEKRFKSIKMAHGDQLVIQRVDEVWEPWEGLSSGEQSAFNLAMAMEFERKDRSQKIIFIRLFKKIF